MLPDGVLLKTSRAEGRVQELKALSKRAPPSQAATNVVFVVNFIIKPTNKDSIMPI
jgi:hypothetical protein